jgi:hypothetical protein
MTISPKDRRELYPLNWGAISWMVLERAEWRCQCHGECGRLVEHLHRADGRCRNRHGQPRWGGQPWQRPVILSAAHLDHDPSSRDLGSILAYCESCHLSFDQPQHLATRRANREAALGLMPLFELT